ncbi:DNA-binding transcriptional LysR family regulator [Kitasatospora sp. MAP12-15]|uniref:LysR substrate-binding domain-containing protein n=1 Tax=unclassified Kitasatospora TaxID=2633591 RepID=UPI002475D272|nr:LysR family transcriptional regulator [Kitasatospora sp. MAP12-44]MDH6111258.1 DNA-binding transcriptional LysR family regulator [Kitasatospora sp. MAP12-44]
MELRQLRYFVTVAEELHFGRAAERLLIGQPAVSQQIRRLERELKVDLFDRTPRLVRLTTAGEAFLPAARAVLTAEDAAHAVAADLAAGRLGVLRLGTITGLGERLDRILDAFEQHAPTLRVELIALPVKERLAHLADGRLDAAFVRGAAGPEPAELRRIPLWQDELVAAVPAGHPLAEQPSVRLADLAELPLRLTARRNHPSLVDLVLTGCRQAGFEPIPGPASSTLQDTLAAIGAGTPMWTVVYAANARIMRIPRVAFVPFAPPGPALPTALVLRRGAASAGLELLLKACKTPLTCDDQES